MKLENQVTSLELSKKLKELGVKQESHFFWENLDEWILVDSDDLETDEYISAFTVAELGEMLPNTFIENSRDHFCGDLIRQKFELKMERVDNEKLVDGNFYTGWIYFYSNGEENIGYKNYNYDTEANARAKCLIYLLENRFINLTNKKV